MSMRAAEDMQRAPHPKHACSCAACQAAPGREESKPKAVRPIVVGCAFRPCSPFIEYITGKLPFEGEQRKRNPHQIGAAVERDTPNFGLLTAAGAPEEVISIIIKAMQKERDDRYSTTAEMLKAIEGVEALILLDSLNEAVEDNDLDKFQRCLARLNFTKAQQAAPTNTESYPVLLLLLDLSAGFRCHESEHAA